ncbi:hypothetical protein HDZ31DRAFT_36992 [Schizophyllum fasciatum]
MSRLDVHIYEAAHELNQAGAGIVFYSRTLGLLHGLGFGDVLSKFESVEPRGSLVFSLRKSDQPEGTCIHDMILPGPMCTLHRAGFQQMILDALSPEVHVHLAHRLLAVDTPTDTEAVLKFANGTTATCDLAIGADGLRSNVRPALLERLVRAGVLTEAERADKIDPVWTGTHVYRGLIHAEELQAKYPGHPCLTKPTQFIGRDKHITSYPIAQGRYVNVVPTYSDFSQDRTHIASAGAGAQATNEEILPHFEGWEELATVLVENFKCIGKWPIMQLSPLPKYADGRIILLGDSAHAMSQHLGAGAGQSIEDGLILARCLNRALNKTQGAPPPDALAELVATYNTLRVPIGNYVQERARLQGKVYELAFLDEPALKPEVCLCAKPPALAFPGEWRDAGVREDVIGGVKENARASVPVVNGDAKADNANEAKKEEMTNIYDLPPHYGALSELGKVSCLTTENYSWPSSRFVRRWDEEAERLLAA